MNLLYLRVLKTSISILYRATIEVNRVKKKGTIDTVSMNILQYIESEQIYSIIGRESNFLYKN